MMLLKCIGYKTCRLKVIKHVNIHNIVVIVIVFIINNNRKESETWWLFMYIIIRVMRCPGYSVFIHQHSKISNNPIIIYYMLYIYYNKIAVVNSPLLIPLRCSFDDSRSTYLLRVIYNNKYSYVTYS